MAERVDATHRAPVWREKSNFVIGAALAESDRAEQLWARQIDRQLFEICCIPFFVFDLALGDVVETDDQFDVVRVVRPSGRFVFRIWFGGSVHSPEVVANELSQRGALLEWSSKNLLAVDAANEEVANEVAKLLAEHEAAGRLTYETGRSHS